MTDINFEKLYSDATAQVIKGGVSAELIPSLAEMKHDILEGEQCEQIPSPSFEDFYDWWNHYSIMHQLENGYSADDLIPCLLYTSPSPRDKRRSRMPSSA